MWLAPFAIGVGVGHVITPALGWLMLASTGAFLALQPLTLLVKIAAGRRSARERGPALAWLAIYSLLILIGAAGLVASGQAWVLVLGALALPPLAWQMFLVAQRAERGQMRVEILGAAALALGAPAAYGVAVGEPTITGIWLWALCALQGAGGVVYIFATLVYRRMTVMPAWPDRWRIAGRAVWLHVAMLLAVALLVATGQVPFLILLPFSLLLAEAVYGGLLRPPVGVKPTRIGARQTVVTAVFALLVVAAYGLSPGVYR